MTVWVASLALSSPIPVLCAIWLINSLTGLLLVGITH
jgi:hypothetical protein